MIEVTDEMVQAYVNAWRDRLFKEPQDADRPAVRAGLAAVLAIVERDYIVSKEPPPTECGFASPSGRYFCERAPGHPVPHVHFSHEIVPWS